jgi:hypothetical protein
MRIFFGQKLQVALTKEIQILKSLVFSKEMFEIKSAWRLQLDLNSKAL